MAKLWRCATANFQCTASSFIPNRSSRLRAKKFWLNFLALRTLDERRNSLHRSTNSLGSLQRGNVVPVFAEFVADDETPVSAFKKLSAAVTVSCSNRLKKMTCRDASRLSESTRGSSFKATGAKFESSNTATSGDSRQQTDPLDEVRRLMARYHFVSRPELPRFAAARLDFSATKRSISSNPKFQWRSATICTCPRCSS